jgi:ubiquinone/menaquinone biosynthesis C-methylase UbiE
MGDWIAFWNSEHSIYVNDRHRDVHYRVIADDIAEYVPSPTATVLDFGCGEALHADRIAECAERLILVDAAPNVRTTLIDRFRDNRAIDVHSPKELAEFADRSLDLVVMNSVAQYVSSPELSALLVLFRRLLRPDGLLVVGDVLPPESSAINDVMALMNFAAAHGFLWAALGGVARTAMSDYPQLRSTLGLARYSEAAMIEKLAAAGYTATRAPTNIGHNPTRMTFRARLA